MKHCSLDEVLTYRNPFVVERFAGKHRVAIEDAEEIFREMLKLVWLMGTSPSKIKVYRPMTVIDEMWHEFILFSREYTGFCRARFGRYVHHKPTTSADRARTKDVSQLRVEIEAQCRYISEKLGGETLTRWFVHFPTRFPAFTS